MGFPICLAADPIPWEEQLVEPLVLLGLGVALALGLAAGSFINVCVARLPWQRSTIWPSSRCLSCYQPVPLWYNFPVLGYLLLGGRCAVCKQRFSIRYPLVELLTGVAFVLLYWFVVLRNLHEVPLLDRHAWEMRRRGEVPPYVWPLALHHAVLFCFLLVASLCDIDEMEIPLSVTVVGTIVGVLFAVVQPWPLPDEFRAMVPPQLGTYPWPVWYDLRHPEKSLPDWLPPGGPLLGLLTGLAGAAVGALLVRGIAFLFRMARGIEGMGLGDADLLMMAGAFVGWQPVVIGFFLSLVPGLPFGILHALRKGNQPFAFGPSLAIGVFLALLFWQDIAGPTLAAVFFDAVLVGALAGTAAFVLIVVGFFLRLVR